MRAEDYARALFRFIDLEKAPVQIESILNALAIEMIEDDFIGLDGIAFKRPEYKLIIVNRSLTPERKRFTIAHELGHIRMPHRGGYQLCYPGKNALMERSADRFAAELLMPEPLVKKLWARFQDNEEYRISIIAEKLLVSKSAMAIRIRGLNLK